MSYQNITFPQLLSVMKGVLSIKSPFWIIIDNYYQYRKMEDQNNDGTRRLHDKSDKINEEKRWKICTNRTKLLRSIQKEDIMSEL